MVGQDTGCGQLRHTRLTASKPWPATGLARLTQKELMAKHLCGVLLHILMVTCLLYLKYVRQYGRAVVLHKFVKEQCCWLTRRLTRG